MTEKKIKQVRVKRWMKISGGVIVALTLFFLLLPVGAKYYLADWLEKNGADSATITKLRFNPFAGKVTLGGVEVQRDGQSILHNASMVLNLGITSLFNRDIRVEKAEYHDLSIDLEQYKDGSWRFGSYTVKGEGQEKTVDSGEEVASAWNFLADQVVLTDCSVHLKTPELSMTLVIEEAELIRLTTREEQPAGSFTFKGRLNDGPVALQLNTVQLVPGLRLGGRISLSAFQLDELSGLLADIMPTLIGEFGLDGQLLFSRDRQSGIEVEYDGNIGVTGPNIGNSDFATKIENLNWKGRMHYAGPERGPIQIETDGLLAARDFHLQHPASELVTEESRIDLHGKTRVTIAENILIENDGSLLLEGIELLLPAYGIAEETFSWRGKVQYDSNVDGEGIAVLTNGSLDLGEFQFGGGEQTSYFATGGKMFSWQGVVGFSQQNSNKQAALELDGTLAVGEILTTLSEPQLRLGQEKVELKTKVDIKFGETGETFDATDIRGMASLTLANFSLYEKSSDSPLVAFDRLAMAEVEGQGGKTIAVKDIITLGMKSSLSGDFPLEVDIPKIRLADISTKDLVTFTAGELQVKNTLVTAAHNNKELVRLDDLTAGVVSYIGGADGATVGIDNTRLHNFSFLGSQDDPAQKAAVSFSDAIIDDMSWSNDTGFQGESLLFSELVAEVVRDKQGNINISRQLAKMQQLQENSQAAESVVETSEKNSDGSPDIPFKIGKIVVAGESAIHFEDYTSAVPYITNLALSRLEVIGIDSSQPEQKTALLLQGELENRAPLEIAGDIHLFPKTPAANIELELKNYPLPKLSAYTVQAVGTALASGQLQLNSSMVLSGGKIDMDNFILLKKLKTETISPELAAELNNQLPIPLDAALSMLKDKDKNISLNVPLNGPVSDLNVGISGVLITALSKAIVPAASGYLMYALGPYGALAYVGMKVGENLLQVELPPLVFVQQEILLTEDHQKYLERIGNILQERPETDIQLCPQVASWELLTKQEKAAIQGKVVKLDESQKQELEALGQQRAEAVQNLLEDDYSIARNRLLICDTKIQTEKDAVPSVLLQL